MRRLFKVTTILTKVGKNGAPLEVAEQHLVEGGEEMTTEDASRELIEKLARYSGLQVKAKQVTALGRSEWISSERLTGDYYPIYKATLKVWTEDEHGKLSVGAQNYYLAELDLTSALAAVDKHMANYTLDYEKVSATKTNITDITFRA